MDGLKRIFSPEYMHEAVTCILAVMCYGVFLYMLVMNMGIPGEFLGIVGVITGYYFRTVTTAIFQPPAPPQEIPQEFPRNSPRTP